MCCKNIERSGAMTENEYVSSATCEKCFGGIKTEMENLGKGQEDIKTLISADKKESARKQMLWVAIASIAVGLLSNLDKLSVLFK